MSDKTEPAAPPPQEATASPAGQPAADTPPDAPSEGVAVLHLFCKPTPLLDRTDVLSSIDKATANGVQVVMVVLLGHKADLAVMAVAPGLRALRTLQTDLQLAGLDVVDSYVSITELSEYAQGLPEQMRNDRLYPRMPPDGKQAWCFYPMSKRRNPEQNWYTEPYERRKELMYEHGTSGRKFAGRLVQLITASTGLDDYEWGVTLFAVRPDVLKEVVYTMRYDQASAVYAEFGPFYTGMVTEPAAALTAIGSES